MSARGRGPASARWATPIATTDRREHQQQGERGAGEQQARRAMRRACRRSRWTSEGARSRSSSGLSGRPRLERIASSPALSATTSVVAAAAA